jgi:hypothetical protein
MGSGSGMHGEEIEQARVQGAFQVDSGGLGA